MAPPRITIPVGSPFGEWTTTGPPFMKGVNSYVPCRCSCGQECDVYASHLHRGRSSKCKKCSSYENGVRRAGQLKKHGEARSPEYYAWFNMVSRCTKPELPNSQNYIGRGIRVCDRWMTFENFLADVGRRPSPKHTIDRYPDNDGNYEPGNVRWATRIEQSNNKRNNRRLTVNGVSKTIAEWARALDIDPMTLKGRLAAGWSPERAVTEPPHRNKGPRRRKKYPTPLGP